MLISDESIRALRNIARVRLADDAARSKTIVFRCDEAISILDEIACLRAENERLRAELDDLKARGVVPDKDCTCGSGGHPRHCEKHPHRLGMHCAELDVENELAELRAARLRPETVDVVREALEDLAADREIWEGRRDHLIKEVKVAREDFRRCYPPEEV